MFNSLFAGVRNRCSMLSSPSSSSSIVILQTIVSSLTISLLSFPQIKTAFAVEISTAFRSTLDVSIEGPIASSYLIFTIFASFPSTRSLLFVPPGDSPNTCASALVLVLVVLDPGSLSSLSESFLGSKHSACVVIQTVPRVFRSYAFGRDTQSKEQFWTTATTSSWSSRKRNEKEEEEVIFAIISSQR